jgi:uncharacterized protein YqhQ
MSGSSSGAPMYGGQAVIEGVMMRGTQQFAVACRRANGEIALTCELVPKALRPAWQKWPFLRGAFALVDSMALGTKALFWAARVAEQDIPQPEEKVAVRAAEETVGVALGSAAVAEDPIPAEANTPPQQRQTSKVSDVAMGSALATGLLFFVGLFKMIPIGLVWVLQQLGVTSLPVLVVSDLAIRLTIFVAYVSLVARMKHVYRVFQYHGAEHKAINALEAGGPLTVETARAASRLHPRCGTSFVVLVLLLSVIAAAPFYGQPIWLRSLITLAMVIPVAGVGFELLRLAGRFRDNPVAAALSRPGMWTQLLTTREPDDSQLEVALASLVAVIDAEEGKDPVARIRTTTPEAVTVA